MRSHDLDRVVAALREPIRVFVREARVRLVLLVSSSGQVLAQHGFSGQYQVRNVASLAAAVHASAGALADLVGAGRWQHMHHAGIEQQLFLASIPTPVEDLVLVAILTDDSSLGLVQLFFEKLAADVAALPALQESGRPVRLESFEGDLEAGLRQVFRRPDPGS